MATHRLLYTCAMTLSRLANPSIGAALCLMAGRVHALDDWTNSRESYLCKSSTEVREIRTYVRDVPRSGTGDERTCRVDYLKGGVTQTLWSAHDGHAYCYARAADLVAKLTTNYFHCERLRLGAGAQ